MRVLSALCPVICLAASLFFPAILGQAAERANQQLYSFFNTFLDQRFAMHPLEATELGDHRFDSRLDDLSPDALKRSIAHLEQTLKQLPRDVKYASLDRDGQIDYEIFEHDLERAIWLQVNTKPFENDARLYNRYISDSVYLLLTQSRLPGETNIANAIGRIREIPAVVAAAKQNLKHPHRPALETAIRQNRGSIAFYQKDLFKMTEGSPQTSKLQAEAARAADSLKEYQTFLESLLPGSNPEWRLGKRKFSKKLELVLDAGITADQALKEAEAEFERVQREMYVVARQLWSHYYPTEAMAPYDAAGVQAAIGKVLTAISHEHGKPAELVADARATVNQIKDFIREKDILRLPDPDRCQVIEMPEFQRGNAVAYLNAAPPLDPEAPSFYAISPPASDWPPQQAESLLQEYNRHMLQILTIHEAYPGHYVQLEYSNRSRSPVRRAVQSGVFVEGWAVYTEQTMLDQGYGSGDLALRMQQLKFYLRAVANAILDHKLHCTQMTDEEAIRFLIEQAYQSNEEARQKIVRAKQTSVQLSTYFVGRMAIYRLRQQIQREQGKQFELGRFHEAVLDHGSVPVKYLPELVRKRLERPR
jgi:uncharacterized protein (DUF885 family)